MDHICTPAPVPGHIEGDVAIAGGSYSATAHCGSVGPEGGQMLVDRTVELLNGLWKGAK